MKSKVTAIILVLCCWAMSSLGNDAEQPAVAQSSSAEVAAIQTEDAPELTDATEAKPKAGVRYSLVAYGGNPSGASYGSYYSTSHAAGGSYGAYSTGAGSAGTNAGYATYRARRAPLRNLWRNSRSRRLDRRATRINRWQGAVAARGCPSCR